MTSLQIYNSLTQKKEHFKPLNPKEIRIYVCGMTVYDHCHLGHARVFVCFDTIVRFLRHLGYHVIYVRNITDIDDKIIAKAHADKITVSALVARYIQSMQEDFAALNILPPDYEPKATEHMEAMIQLIERLIKKQYAYVAVNGDVYYDVQKFPSYGCLAHKDLSGQLAGKRVATDVKHHPNDFVLWKQAKPQEPAWPSPWGPGRPGWHIECSAMAMHYLDAHFDIHGGGFDLQFPHHENEMAQSVAATDQTYVNYWMHVGYLQINDEKMAKSKGNFLTIKDLLARYHPEVLRYYLLTSHYRSPLNFSFENLNAASHALARLYLAIRDLPEAKIMAHSHYTDAFEQAMRDDFNTPEALAVLFQLAHEIQKERQHSLNQAASLAEKLKQLGSRLGILQCAPLAFFQYGLSELSIAHIESLIKERAKARVQHNWDKADRIRQALVEEGIELADGSLGTTWRRAY